MEEKPIEFKIVDYPYTPKTYSPISSFFYALSNVSKVDASFKEIYSSRRKGATLLRWTYEVEFWNGEKFVKVEQ